jgi:hypothetical protein
MVGLVPVADEGGVVGGGGREGDGDPGAAEDPDAAKAAGGLVEGEGGEVEVGAYLVLGLQVVGEVGAGRDRARRPGNPVLERVPTLLYPVPALRTNIVVVSFVEMRGGAQFGIWMIDRSVSVA